MRDEDGELAVKIARKVVDTSPKSHEIPDFDVPDIFFENRGVFTTLKTYPKKELRGCIGFPEPVMPFIEALVHSAYAAAQEDPRFSPVRHRELNKIVVEVSVLTPPEEITLKPEERAKGVIVGTHGLIAESGFSKGLLLPQVAVEYGWDAEKFLSQTCWKAGLSPDCWLSERTKFYRFSADIFEELEPRGRVVRSRE